MNNNLLETTHLQAVSAKVHWRIKKLLLEAAEKASLTLSEYLNIATPGELYKYTGVNNRG